MSRRIAAKRSWQQAVEPLVLCGHNTVRATRQWNLVVPPRRCAEGRKARVSFGDMLMGFSMEANRSTKALTEEDIELLEGSVYTEIIE
ncbi:hypothetical protein Golob_022076, partial [Gossypium lobatum]|nr:hypothetical protein [Gossypium lobatum]